MQFYWKSMILQMQKKFILRWDLFWSVLTNILWLLLYKVLWTAIYANKTEIAGVSLNYLLGYYLLVRIVTEFTADRIDREISRGIINGSFVSELIRPVNLIGLKTVQKFGTNLIGTVLLGIPVAILALFFLPVPVFHDGLSLLCFFICLLFGLLIQVNINILAGISAFWVKGVEGVTHTKDFIVQIASGALIPLTFLPLSLQKISFFLPFRYIVELPIQVYLRGSSVLTLKAAGIGLIWWIGLMLCNQFLYGKGVKRLTIYGG